MSNDKTTAPKLTEAAIAMRPIVKENIKITDTGVIEADKELFEKTLVASGLTLDEVKKVDTHRANFFAATTAETIDAGLDHMAKNKETALVTAEFAMAGKDKFNVSVKRRDEFADPKDRTKTIEKFGVVTTKYRAYDATTDGGQLRALKLDSAERALKSLANG